MELPGVEMIYLLPLILLYLIYKVFTRNHDYWQKQKVPHVKPVPLFGSVLKNIKRPFHENELENYKKYGRIYGFYEGTLPVLSIGEPHLLRSILVKDFHYFTNRRDFPSGNELVEKMLSLAQGEDWKRLRSIISPTFSSGKLKRMTSIFLDCAATLSENLMKAAKEDQTFIAKSLFGAFSMDVIASTAFSTKLDSHNQPNNAFVRKAKTVFGNKFPWKFAFILLFPRLAKYFKVTGFPTSALNFFENITLKIIEERKRTGQTRNDFLQLLLDTAKEISEENLSKPSHQEYPSGDQEQVLKSMINKKPLSHTEMIANCIIFFLAGYETVATSLSFASYLLAIHPDVQDRLVDEIDEVLEGKEGNQMCYEDLQKMKYLDAVVSETLRIYPPGIRTERVAEEDYFIEEIGATVKKGMLVTIPIYAIHRDPEFYPEPEKFDPERFNSEAKATRNQFTYLPFGQGPRNCIAMRFALLEMKICLAYLLTKLKFKKCSHTQVPLEFHQSTGILVSKDIILKIEKREASKD